MTISSNSVFSSSLQEKIVHSTLYSSQKQFIKQSSAAIEVKRQKKRKKTEKIILTAFSGQLSGGSAFSAGDTGNITVIAGATGVTNVGIQGLRGRVTGNTEIQGVTR